jgi:hypothetical protein
MENKEQWMVVCTAQFTFLYGSQYSALAYYLLFISFLNRIFKPREVV